MNRIREIRERLAQIAAELRTMHEGAENRALSTEEQSRWDELMTERGEAPVAAAEGREATPGSGLLAEMATLEARMAQIEELAQDPIQERGEDRGAPNLNRGRDPFDVSDIRLSTPPSAMRARALTAIERVEGLSDEDRESASQTVRRVGGQAIARVLATGSATYRAAFQKVVSGNVWSLDDSERAALERAQSLTNAEGGFAVPFTLDPTILLTNAGTVNPLRRIARTAQITTDTWNGVSSAGATATYKAEAAEATDDSIAIAQPSVPVHRLDVFVPYSLEIEGDWQAFESDMRMVIMDAKERAEATAFTTGSGTNQPTGFVTALDGTASEVAPATAETFAVGDVYALEEALPARFRPQAQFGANRAIYNLVRQFDTSGGTDLWVRLGAGLPPELIGYPANEISDMDDGFNPAATADNFILVIGDWSRFLIVDRVGMNIERVPHLFATANNRPSGQRGLFAWCRNGSDVLTDEAFRLLNVATTV